MKVLHCPVIVADNASVISKYLNRSGVESTVVSYIRTHMGYEGDINLDLDFLDAGEREKKLRAFVSDFIKNQAQKYDIFHFHFLQSFSTGTNFKGWRSHTEFEPYWDLRVLKEMGKKIVVSCFGTDIRNRSKITYYQLKYQYPEVNLPYPPLNQGPQYYRTWQFAKYADAFVCGDTECLKHSPYGLSIPIPIDLEPLEPIRNSADPDQPLSIVHAPTSHLSKGTDMIMKALEKLKVRFPGRFDIRLVQKVSHEEALKMYTGPGLAVDQLTFGFGLFSLESMYLGRPVICSFRREEYLPSDPKCLAPVISVNNEEEFLEKAGGYLEGQHRLDGQDLTDYVVRHHSGDKVAAQYKELYETIMDNQPVMQQVNSRWLAEYDLILNRQFGKLAHWYTQATDFLLAKHNRELLEFECEKGGGLLSDPEVLAKMITVNLKTGNEDRAESLRGANPVVASSDAYKKHRQRAEQIWEQEKVL